MAAAGIADCRVLADLLREDAYDVLANIIGLEETFTESEFTLLEALVKKIGVGSAVLKRIRAADTHFDDVVSVLKNAKNQKAGDLVTKDPSRLPGLKLGLRRFSRNSDGIASGLASNDCKERDK